MALSIERKKEYCQGCRNDIYNSSGLNPTGETECWHLRNAKIVWRKPVHINDVPPWKHKAIRVPHCYHKPKFVFVPAHQTH